MARARAQDYDEKRRQILDRSAELFARKGFTGTSIVEIAKVCGVSKALLYHYYPDKEAVLFHLLEAHLNHLVAVIEGVEAHALEPEAAVEGLCLALLDAYRDSDAEHQVQISSLRLLPAEQQEILKGLERRLVTVFSTAIQRALPEVDDRPALVGPLTMSLFGMLNWHYLWFREGRGLTREGYATLARDLLLGGARSHLDSIGRSTRIK